MTRSASFLAALASAALPGLDPVSVQAVRGRPGDPVDVALVEDSQQRHWVVEAPRSAVAGAMLGDVTELSALLTGRLDIAVPDVKGQVAVPEGRAIVYPSLPGRPLEFSALPPGLGLAADLGRALAHIHNLEVDLFEEAGRPGYDADATRARLLTDLDRAAATGRVPTGLLSRWEHSLEDVSLWRFLPTPVHGSFVGSHVLASFDDEQDADTGRVRAILGWGHSHVGDPADDFADLASSAHPEAMTSVLDAYAPSRVDAPDGNLLRRARLSAELRPLRLLLEATAADDEDHADRLAEKLRALEERIFAEDEARARRPPRRALLMEAPPPPDAPEVLPAQDAQDAPDDAGSLEVTEADQALDEVPLSAPPSRRARTTSPDVVTVALPVDAVAEAQTKRERSGPGDGEPRAADPTRPSDPAAAESAAIHFEIEQVESVKATDAERPAPDEDPEQVDDGVLDLHEGASEFVRVDRPDQGTPESHSS